MKIGLCCIIKNEEKLIWRMLESVKDFVDYYVIVDTGSTDNTIELVEEFIYKNNVKAELHYHTFEDFSESRNLSIEKLGQKTDFGFIIDADEILAFTENFKKEDLHSQLENIDFGLIGVLVDGSNYSRGAFFRTNKNFRYEGVVHEALNTNEIVTSKIIEGLVIVQEYEEESMSPEQIKEKYLLHANAIKIDIEKNGVTPRKVFYLAQSYKDANELDQAMLWYNKRIKIIGGFEEERYYSQLMIAGLKWIQGKPIDEVENEYLKCTELDELRCEHLYFLKQLYESNELLEKSITIGQKLKHYKNPYPDRVLFINNDAYASN